MFSGLPLGKIDCYSLVFPCSYRTFWGTWRDVGVFSQTGGTKHDSCIGLAEIPCLSFVLTNLYVGTNKIVDINIMYADIDIVSEKPQKHNVEHELCARFHRIPFLFLF